MKNLKRSGQQPQYGSSIDIGVSPAPGARGRETGSGHHDCVQPPKPIGPLGPCEKKMSHRISGWMPHRRMRLRRFKKVAPFRKIASRKSKRCVISLFVLYVNRSDLQTFSRLWSNSHHELSPTKWSIECVSLSTLTNFALRISSDAFSRKLFCNMMPFATILGR